LALFVRIVWLFLLGTAAGGVAVGLIFRGALSELNRLADPQHRAAVVSTFFVAAYLGLGLPVLLTGLFSQLISTIDASAWTSALAGVIVLAAIFVVLRTFGKSPAPAPTCTPSDSWCSPQERADGSADLKR
jgi:MFS family permease